MFVTSNNPIITCFASLSLEMKLKTTKTCAPLEIQRSNVQVVDKQLVNVGTTYVFMSFQPNSIRFPQQMFSWMCAHKLYVIYCSQMDSTIIMGNNPLTKNMKSSTKPNCVRSFFLNLEVLQKKPKILKGKTLSLFY
jgi:hypothetical protein